MRSIAPCCGVSLRRKGPVFQRGLRQLVVVFHDVPYRIRSERPRFSEGIATTQSSIDKFLDQILVGKAPFFRGDSLGTSLCLALRAGGPLAAGSPVPICCPADW